MCTLLVNRTCKTMTKSSPTSPSIWTLFASCTSRTSRTSSYLSVHVHVISEPCFQLSLNTHSVHVHVISEPCFQLSLNTPLSMSTLSASHAFSSQSLYHSVHGHVISEPCFQLTVLIPLCPCACYQRAMLSAHSLNTPLCMCTLSASHAFSSQS